MFWHMVSQFFSAFWEFTHAAGVLAGYQIVFCFYRVLTHETLTLTAVSQYRRRLGYGKDVANHMLPVLNGFHLIPLTAPKVLYIQLHPVYIYTCMYVYIYIYIHTCIQSVAVYTPCIFIYIYTGSLYIYMYIYMCICIYIHVYRV